MRNVPRIAPWPALSAKGANRPPSRENADERRRVGDVEGRELRDQSLIDLAEAASIQMVHERADDVVVRRDQHAPPKARAAVDHVLVVGRGSLLTGGEGLGAR